MRRIVLIGVILLAGAGLANLRAQTVLGDPRDAAKTFASNCSACHKSPQGLAKSGQVAGFLRQHYTTGPEMSAAMAAYLVSAGSGPAAKKGPATVAIGAESPAAGAKTKGKKQEQANAVQSPAEAAQAQTLRGKQRQLREEQAARTAPADHAVAPPVVQIPRPALAPAAEERQAAAPAASAAPDSLPPGAAQQPPAMVLDIPLPPMPDSPPPELSQSAFSSSPLP
jgi:hypothetical protein